MMAIDSQHVTVHLIVSSDVSFRWSLPCRRPCSASVPAAHFAQHPEPPSRVQKSCLELAQPVAVAGFAGRLLVGSATPPDHRCPERKRKAKAEGKTKGFGTLPPAKPVCTWGGRGTERLRRRAAWGARPAPMQACPRASHDRTRQSLRGAQP